ncbi:MAG: hypothetical protein ACKN9E_04855 [Microcystaceae cyanobacterium]
MVNSLLSQTPWTITMAFSASQRNIDQRQLSALRTKVMGLRASNLS